MAYGMDPVTAKGLVEAEGDVARHGVVIIRTLETDLAPSIMAAARDSMESSPRRLARLTEEDLDELVQTIRKASLKSARELTKLYTRVLSRLGKKDVIELERDLEGVDQLFKWPRIAEAVGPVSTILVEHGFSPAELSGPDEVSEGLSLELEGKWRPAFARFSTAVRAAAVRARAEAAGTQKQPRRAKKERKE